MSQTSQYIPSRNVIPCHFLHECHVVIKFRGFDGAWPCLMERHYECSLLIRATPMMAQAPAA
eukprot:scaffold14686_cov22-Prasinocladus_malaysianus.AAC.1